VLCGAAMVVGVAACASEPTVVPVPTFPQAVATPTNGPAPAREAGHSLPADCEALVGHDELSALFGLPLGSVTVRTVQGTPSPSVGRLERMSCTYTVSSPAASPLQGVVLEITAGAYRDATAARDQHERNVADERVGASRATKPDLGDASATLVERDGQSVLLTSFDTVTLDLDLTRRPGPWSPADLLTDLARRGLARVATEPSHDSAK
jgi:hypothetical protein